MGFPRDYGALWDHSLHANKRGYYNVTGRVKESASSTGNSNGGINNSRPSLNNNRKAAAISTRAGGGGAKGAGNSDVLLHVPKIVWIYWSQGADALQASRLEHRRCYASWVENNIGWDVRVVSASTLHDNIDVDQTARVLAVQSLQAQSDLARLYLLARHGGVYVDADVYSVIPLDDWLPPLVQPSGTFLFSLVGRDRLVATWFMAATARSSLIEAWAETTADYLITHEYKFEHYLQVHYIFSSIVGNNNTAGEHVTPATAAAAAVVWGKMPKINVTTSADEPCCTAILPLPHGVFPKGSMKQELLSQGVKGDDRGHNERASELKIRNKVLSHGRADDDADGDGRGGNSNERKRYGAQLPAQHHLKLQHKVLSRRSWHDIDRGSDDRHEQEHQDGRRGRESRSAPPPPPRVDDGAAAVHKLLVDRGVLPRVAVRALDGGFCAPCTIEASIMFRSLLVPVVKGKAKQLHGNAACPQVDHSDLMAVPPQRSILAELDAMRAHHGL